MTETILIETKTFILKIVTTRRSERKAIINKMKYEIPGIEEPAYGSFESGHETIETADHTISLTAMTGEQVTFACNGQELESLISALGKARPFP